MKGSSMRSTSQILLIAHLQMDPGCEKELAMLCQFDRTNQTACLACVKENEKVLIEREHCNRTEVMKFC